MSRRGAIQSIARCVRSAAGSLDVAPSFSVASCSRQLLAQAMPNQALHSASMFQQGAKLSSRRSQLPLSFAASSLNSSPLGLPISSYALEAAGQVRGAASDASSVDGDGDAGKGVSSSSRSTSFQGGRGSGGGGGADLPRRRGPPPEDPTELLIFAKESFMKKTEDAIPIPPNIREVLYKYQWDKLLVDVRRTTDLTVKGKVEKYSAMVAVGNLKGLFGLGMGSSGTAQEAVAFAYMDAYSKLVYIPLYRGHTIYHHIDYKIHHMKIRLMPRREGWGVKASDLVTELCGLIGIKNISVKLIGRRSSKFFVAQGLLEALQQQTTSYDGIEGTGVYAREVFWKNQLPEGLKRGEDIP